MFAQSQVTCNDCGGRGRVIVKSCPNCTDGCRPQLCWGKSEIRGAFYMCISCSECVIYREKCDKKYYYTQYFLRRLGPRSCSRLSPRYYPTPWRWETLSKFPKRVFARSRSVIFPYRGKWVDWCRPSFGVPILGHGG